MPSNYLATEGLGRSETGEFKKSHGQLRLHGTTYLTTWDDIFRDIGPALINEATDTSLQATLARFHVFQAAPDGFDTRGEASIAPETWNEVLVQFRALGLLDQGIKKRGVNDRSSYWRITPLGDRHLVNLLARKRAVASHTESAPTSDLSKTT